MSASIPLIAVGHDRSWIAIACGHNVHVFKDARNNSKPLVLSSVECIRTLCVSPDEAFLLSSGDDKVVNIWSTQSWERARDSTAAKKVASGCFTPDSQYAIVGDKFGDVSIMATQGVATGLKPLLGHYCATVTTLSVAATGRLLASGDRDGRLRVSILSDTPLAGSWEIMTFCLSHTAAITCSTFCWTGSGQEEVLVSGALDGQIIAWDHTTGKDLCRIQPSASTVGATSDQGPAVPLHIRPLHYHAWQCPSALERAAIHELGLVSCPHTSHSMHAAGVLALASQGQWIAAVVEKEATVVIAHCTRDSDGAVQLQQVSRISVEGIALPCSLFFASSQEVWVVGCVSADGQGGIRAGCIHLTGDGSWQCWQDSEVAANICKHLDTLPACTVEQFNSLLQKRDYHPEEKEERQGDCSKRQRQQSEAGAAVETQA